MASIVAIRILPELEEAIISTAADPIMNQPGMTTGYPAPQAAHHELRTVANSAVYLLDKLESMKQSNPHLRLLDVGTGSGTIPVAFAKAIPEGQVTGCDIKEDILPRARAIAEMEGVKNIEFQQADVYKLPFADATFDITHSHQVLIHLKAPCDALREMLRVTKPGGVVAAREGDFESECIWPESPGLLNFHSFIAKFIKISGGSPTAGRQLLSWALKAGVRRGQITASHGTWSYSTEHEKKVWAQAMVDSVQGGRMRKAGLDAGLITEDDADEMAQAWEEWASKDDAILSMMSGEILIQK
ncbi:S-adenosyl-L-methionine-dependent methyltransferase [Xylariales sp. AK1849]|nr:S-adenosyl-L-methionine-dependent methyltransferase [Xylariales sp. AK1849]